MRFSIGGGTTAELARQPRIVLLKVHERRMTEVGGWVSGSTAHHKLGRTAACGRTQVQIVDPADNPPGWVNAARSWFGRGT
jgi:hypothetical protein